MFFVKINGELLEFQFRTKKDTILYIIDHLSREGVDEPVIMLKKAKKTRGEDYEEMQLKDDVFRIEQWYEYRKCTICHEPMKSKHVLDCKHNVCLICLPNLRKNECPVCRKELSGNVITDEILCNILQRTEIDEHESRQRDMTMAMAAEIGYNPNELY